MYCRRSDCHGALMGRQQGIALILALLVLALSTALIVGLERDFTLSYQRASNRHLGEQGWQYLYGAEELASTALRLDFEADVRSERLRDDLSEIWAQQATPYALDEGGWIVGALSDLQGRFNLNSLAAQPPPQQPGQAQTARFSAEQQMFIRLLQALDGLGLSEYEAIVVTESIGDWLDEDDSPRLNGAESSFYSGLQPAYWPGNGPMAAVSELRAVANVSPELYAALEPIVTVWPREPRPLNIHTAAPVLLRALNADGNLQPLSESEGTTLLQLREEGGFVDREDLFAQPVFSGGNFQGLAALVGESSGYFLLDARVEIAERTQRLYSVLRRDSGRVEVVARARQIPQQIPGNGG